MPRRVVLTLGTFDGVHRGHQALLAEARARAGRDEVVAAAFTHPPRLFFHPAPGPQLLTTPGERAEALRRFGADRVEFLTFDRDLARLSAGAFLRRYILGRWRAADLVVGFNFAFGRDRGGDAAFLRRHAPGLRVHRRRALRDREGVISSERVRDALRAGDVSTAARLLGRPHALTGPVVRGRRLGRRLGYPTANLAAPPDKILPPGVFAVRALLPTGIWRGGMINVGRRPTVSPTGPWSVEAHLFDFTGDLVGRPLTVEFIRRLRPERRFPSLTALTRQLALDEKNARRVLPSPRGG